MSAFFALAALLAGCGAPDAPPAATHAPTGSTAGAARPAPGGTLALALADGTARTLTIGGAFVSLGNQGDGNMNFQLRLFEKTDAPTTCETEAWSDHPVPGGGWAILPTGNTWDGKPGKTDAPATILSPAGKETYWSATLTITSIEDGLLVGELSGAGEDGSAPGVFVATICRDERAKP